MRHVALLRGVNVGGKRKLPMKDLAVLFAEVGCRDVKTFIQSGNVVFEADPKVLKGLAATIAARIEERFGFPTPVVLRSGADLVRVVKANPFPDADPDKDPLHVMFLADEPDAKGLASLDPDRSPPDLFVVKGSEIYLLLANGVARSKLTNDWFDRRLGTISTTRNWRTVRTLRDMATA